MWSAVLGGLASGLAGGLAGDSASDKQATTARKQVKFAKKQYKTQDALLSTQFAAQKRDTDAVRARAIGTATTARSNDNALAQRLRDAGITRATATYARDTGANDNALASIRGDLLDARGQSIVGLGRARDDAIKGLEAARYKSILGIQDARDTSIEGFQPALDMGNNALSAYTYNLGLGGGKRPEGYAGLGFTAGDRFLLNEGVTNIQGSAAARGTLESGATLEALEKMRAGLAATRRDQSQAELFGLGQLGQSAAGNIANLRTGAAGDIAGLRTGTADRIAGLRTGTASDIANLRTGTASQLAGATTDHANRDIAINDANYARRQGVDSAYIGSAQGAYDDFASRLLGIDQNWLSGLGTARNNRANLMGSAASQYGTNALTGMANLGDARAAGAANWGTAIQNGINTGMSIYGYNQANRGPESYMPSVTGPMARPANLGANANALSGIGSWIGGLFGRAGVA